MNPYETLRTDHQADPDPGEGPISTCTVCERGTDECDALGWCDRIEGTYRGYAIACVQRSGPPVLEWEYWPIDWGLDNWRGGSADTREACLLAIDEEIEDEKEGAA